MFSDEIANFPESCKNTLKTLRLNFGGIYPVLHLVAGIGYTEKGLFSLTIAPRKSAHHGRKTDPGNYGLIKVNSSL